MTLMLESVSCDTNGIIDGTIAFLRSRQLKWGTTSHFWFLHHWHWCCCHMMATVLSITSLHSLGQDNWKEVQHDVFIMWHHWCWHLYYVMTTASSINPINWINSKTTEWEIYKSIINGINAVLGSRWTKLGPMWLFLVMWPNNVVYMLTYIAAHTSQKNTILQLLFPCYKHTCTNNKYATQIL